MLKTYNSREAAGRFSMKTIAPYGPLWSFWGAVLNCYNSLLLEEIFYSAKKFNTNAGFGQNK